MAAPTVVNASSTETISLSTSGSVTAPASLVVGNVLLLYISSRNTANTFTPPTVAAGAQPWVSILSGSSSNVFWKPVDGNEGASFTFTWGSGAAAVIIVLQISGASTFPVDAVSTMSDNISSTNILATAATARWNADLMVCFYETNTGNAITVPGGQSSIGSNVSSKAVIAGYQTLAANGTTGTRTATSSVAALNQGCSILLREPSVIGSNFAWPYNITNAANAQNYGAGGQGLCLDSAMGGRWGRYKVSGNTKVNGTLTPLVRKVMLMTADGTGAILGTQSIASDGSFSFTNISAGNYIVLGVDQNNVQNAVVAARIAAVAM